MCPNLQGFLSANRAKECVLKGIELRGLVILFNFEFKKLVELDF